MYQGQSRESGGKMQSLHLNHLYPRVRRCMLHSMEFDVDVGSKTWRLLAPTQWSRKLRGMGTRWVDHGWPLMDVDRWWMWIPSISAIICTDPNPGFQSFPLWLPDLFPQPGMGARWGAAGRGMLLLLWCFKVFFFATPKINPHDSTVYDS